MRTSDEFQRDDLLPPSAEGLLRHLRLPKTAEPSVSWHIAQAAQSLLDDEGLPKALERLIGLPLPLPHVLIQAIITLSSEQKRALIKQLLRITGSPVSRMHLLHILLHCGDDIPSYRRLARQVIHKMFHTEAVVEFDAFVAVLKWVNETFGRWQELQSWSPSIRLAVVWSHAHRLFSTFVSVGATIAWLREAFETRLSLSYETWAREPDYWFDIAHPWQISREPFLLHGVASGLGDNAARFAENGLRALFFTATSMTIDGQRLPALTLRRDSSQARNSLAAFLGGDRSAKLAPSIGEGNAKHFARSSLHELVSQAVNTLTDLQEGYSAWQTLNAVLGDLPPYPEVREQLKTALYRTDFVRLCEQNREEGWLAMHTATLQGSHLNETDLCNYLKDQLMGITRILAKENNDAIGSSSREGIFSEPRKACHWLLEWALNLCRAAPSLPDAIAEFVALLTRLVEAWPFMITICKPIVQDFAEELSVSHAQPFWSLLVRLRAA